MLRWVLHRRLWAGVVGTIAAVGLAGGQGGMELPSGPPKAGDVITLKFKDSPDRQFKVIKVEQQPDGAYLSEIKDVKSGEILTLYDKPTASPAKAPAPAKTMPPAKRSDPPAEPPIRASSSTPVQSTPTPLIPVAPALTPGDIPARPAEPTPPPKPNETPKKDSIWSRLRLRPSDSSANKSPEMPAYKNPGLDGGKSGATAATPLPETPQDPQKKPGLLSRIFGPKKPNPPAGGSGTATGSMTGSASAPVTTAPVTTAPVTTAPVKTPSPLMPPVVRPTPGFPSTGSTTEPPRVAPAPSVPLFPGTTPAPSVPLFPSSTPSVPPLAPPTRPVPATPAPAPMAPGLPTIPIPPGRTSLRDSTLVQTRYQSPVIAAMIEEIQPYAKTLRMAHAPSERIYALQALAGCRHASTDTVKNLLYRACVSDPCSLVRACCIDELCKLGYFHPAFLSYLEEACTDPSAEVRMSAKNALRVMTPHE